MSNNFKFILVSVLSVVFVLGLVLPFLIKNYVERILEATETAQEATLIAQETTLIAQEATLTAVAETQTANPTETVTIVASPTSPTSTPCAEFSVSPSLRIQQPNWEDFITGYNKSFREIADEWECKTGVKVEIDHEDIYKLDNSLGAELNKPNHDLFALILPPHEFEDQLEDLKLEIAGYEQSDICIDSIKGYKDPDKTIGFCLGHTPELSHFRRDLWNEAKRSTYNDLLEEGAKIKNENEPPFQVGLGGYVVKTDKNLDANNAIRAVMWSNGVYVQDEDEQVVINSSKQQEEMLEVIEYMVKLYDQAVLDTEVTGWHDLSNNVCFTGSVDGGNEPDCSYILNAILSDSNDRVVKKEHIVISPPLKGSKEAVAPPHVTHIYVIPTSVEEEKKELAKDFLYYLASQSEKIITESNGYIVPAWSNQDTLNRLDDDKSILKRDAQRPETLELEPGWSRNIGYPGLTNAAVMRVFQDNILPEMIHKVISGESKEAALQWAEGEICKIFEEEEISDCQDKE